MSSGGCSVRRGFEQMINMAPSDGLYTPVRRCFFALNDAVEGGGYNGTAVDRNRLYSGNLFFAPGIHRKDMESRQHGRAALRIFIFIAGGI